MILAMPENLHEVGEDEDIELSKLIATCFLEDIAQLQAAHKGKSKAGTSSDDQLALEMFAEEANTFLASTRDLEIALGLEKAMRMDSRVIQELCIAEERASRDREMALALDQGRPPPPRPPTPVSPEASAMTEEISDMSLSQPDWYDSDSDDDNTRKGASSSKTVPSVVDKTTAATFCIPRPLRPSVKREHRNCVICDEKIKGVEIPAPCGHFYDRDCLVELYKAITRDEELFPPRCCQQEFDLTVVRRYLPVQLASLFFEKAREYRTVDRVYCHRPTCSAFLGTKTSHVSAIHCPRCATFTCGSCKAAVHPGEPCTAQSDEAVLALAEENGWKRCPGCNHLVELAHGCFHMTCRCKYQFCYLCTARWKTCTCVQWDENRLVVAAHDQVERRIHEEPAGWNVNAPVPNFDALVAREVERLREDHECHHGSWQYCPGRGRCEHCNYVLPIFLLRCRRCHTMACVRCRRNRL